MSSLITITGSGRADQLAKVCCELRSPLTLTTNVDPFFQVYVPPNPSPTPPFRRNCAHLVRGHGIRARGRRYGRHGHQRAHSHVDPQFLAWNHRPLSNFRIFSSISEPFFPSFHFFVGIAGLSFAQPPDFRFSRDIANNLLFLFRSPTHFSHKRRHKNLASGTQRLHRVFCPLCSLFRRRLTGYPWPGVNLWVKNANHSLPLFVRHLFVVFCAIQDYSLNHRDCCLFAVQQTFLHFV